MLCGLADATPICGLGSGNTLSAAQTDSTITSAVLDRLLHHAETVLTEGSSYRMKDRIES
jgi:DNA replication protein DnaC